MGLGKEVFIIHIVYLTAKILIYLAFAIQIALLIAKNIIILAKYLDFLDIFLKKSAMELF